MAKLVLSNSCLSFDWPILREKVSGSSSTFGNSDAANVVSENRLLPDFSTSFLSAKAISTVAPSDSDLQISRSLRAGTVTSPD